MKPPSPSRWQSVLRRVLRVGLGFVLVLALAIAVRSYYAFRDRLPGYALDLTLDGQALARGLGGVHLYLAAGFLGILDRVHAALVVLGRAAGGSRANAPASHGKPPP